jgi:hypothetical protein
MTMISDLVNLFEKGELKEPEIEVLELSEEMSDGRMSEVVREAISRSIGGGSGKKVVLKWENRESEKSR